MIAIIDHGMGNLGSVQNMLRRVGAQSVRTTEPADITRASRLVLAGVGAFDAAMERLEALGLVDVLHEQVIERRVPILGVCLGMQLMASSSQEGSRAGLGWIDGHVRAFSFPSQDQLPIPHMGWEAVVPTRPSPLFEPGGAEQRFYFSHKFHLVADHAEDVAATSFYGYDFTAALHRHNILGTQFHPEKSHVFGLNVYRRFVDFSPE